MAFGIDRKELVAWKKRVRNGEVALLTHFWQDDRFPGAHSITKAGCNDLEKLRKWGEQYGLKKEWIHHDRHYPHFDLFGEHQKYILEKERMWNQMRRFNI